MKISRSTAALRSRILRGIRLFFDERDYLEVATPILTPELIPEAHIDNFVTEYLHFDGTRTSLYLEPSPEIWMKILISEGWGDIYQIVPAFRNRESIGRLHNPEFCMLEWYTMQADYRDSIATTEELFSRLCSDVVPDAPADTRPPFRIMSMQEAFREIGGMQLPKRAVVPSLQELCHRMGSSFQPDDDAESLFNRLFVAFIEPELPSDHPLVLTDYPSWIPTLAKSQGTVAERWELYVRGMELANCYTEETDHNTVQQYWSDQIAARAAAPIGTKSDPSWPSIFRRGFPECSGVAMGLDRLVMALTGSSDIGGVIFFPFPDILDGHFDAREGSR